MNDRALIAFNRELLTTAAEMCAWAREAQERAGQTVRTAAKSRAAWALLRQRRGRLPSLGVTHPRHPT